MCSLIPAAGHIAQLRCVCLPWCPVLSGDGTEGTGTASNPWPEQEEMGLWTEDLVDQGLPWPLLQTWSNGSVRSQSALGQEMHLYCQVSGTFSELCIPGAPTASWFQPSAGTLNMSVDLWIPHLKMMRENKITSVSSTWRRKSADGNIRRCLWVHFGSLFYLGHYFCCVY